MIQRVYEQAILSDAEDVIVATDDQRIAETVVGFGGRVCMTRKDHASGTDRLQEVSVLEGFSGDEIIVNVQGDEPLIPPEVINQVAQNLSDTKAPMATLCEAIQTLEDMLDPNIVKVTTDENDIALYFSRAPIPYDRDNFTEAIFQASNQFKRHVGIYAYRVSLLNEFVTWAPDDIEQLAKLEQLRILRKGRKIHVAEAVTSIPPGIDTVKDLERTRALLSAESTTN